MPELGPGIISAVPLSLSASGSGPRTEATCVSCVDVDASGASCFWRFGGGGAQDLARGQLCWIVLWRRAGLILPEAKRRSSGRRGCQIWLAAGQRCRPHGAVGLTGLLCLKRPESPIGRASQQHQQTAGDRYRCQSAENNSNEGAKPTSLSFLASSTSCRDIHRLHR